MPVPPHEDKPSDGAPMFNRIAKAGASGVGASTIGLTLAFCIVGGALAGVALDRHFGTQYWTPILFLVGVAAGFIQMIRTLGDVNRLEEAEQRRAQAEKASASAPAPAVISSVTPPSAVPSRPSRVPAPPTASFDAPATTPSVELPSDVQDDLATLRRMLQEERGTDERKEGKP